MIKKILLSIILVSGFYFGGYSQEQKKQEPVVIDEIVAIVGANTILLSDLEGLYMQELMQGSLKGFDTKCSILEELLFQKLLLNQAELDSVEVTDKQVDGELDRRMRLFISQAGSKEKLEEYFGKTILEMKEDMRDNIKQNMKIQTVQQKITENVKITPSDVSDFYKSVPTDSMLLVGAEYEIAQIVITPAINEAEVAVLSEKLNKLKERIKKGDDFAVLANLYSEDEKTNKKGGETGFVGRGELEPEVEAVAFGMKKNEISEIIKAQKGYYIIQMIERRGEFINIRKIMMMAKPSITEMSKSKTLLDKIRSDIMSDSTTFDKAGKKYSDSKTKNNGSLLVNPYTGNTRFEAAEIDPDLFFIIDKMKVGEITTALPMKTEDGMPAYRIIYLKSRTTPHKANLKEDYPRIQSLALQFKQKSEVNKWIKKKSVNTYIRINDSFKKCNLKFDWGAK
jgi:peptidyl-prolyl cis-trans isomerase SurA